MPKLKQYMIQFLEPSGHIVTIFSPAFDPLDEWSLKSAYRETMKLTKARGLETKDIVKERLLAWEPHGPSPEPPPKSAAFKN